MARLKAGPSRVVFMPIDTRGAGVESVREFVTVLSETTSAGMDAERFGLRLGGRLPTLVYGLTLLEAAAVLVLHFEKTVNFLY